MAFVINWLINLLRDLARCGKAEKAELSAEHSALGSLLSQQYFLISSSTIHQLKTTPTKISTGRRKIQSRKSLFFTLTFQRQFTNSLK